MGVPKLGNGMVAESVSAHAFTTVRFFQSQTVNGNRRRLWSSAQVKAICSLGLMLTVWRKLEESVPTVWVTVPTKERLDLGLIVNGKFDLDVGRAQLAQDSRKNMEVADSIGRELGESLIELFDEANDNWSGFCDILNLSEDSDPYQFWDSMWLLFSRGTWDNLTNPTEANQLIHHILWKSSEHGMGKLFQQRPAIPSGLWGDYKTLTKLDQFQFKTVGVLDTDESVFCKVCQWPQFQQQILPGQVVSDGKIASVLMRLLSSENVNVQEVRIYDLIHWELGSDKCVDVSQASRLGSLITREFLNELNRGNRDQRKEYDELKAFLSDVRFRACDGGFHAAEDLLINDARADNCDEPRRAAFAPEDRLLTDDYTDSALNFFIACRRELNAPSQLMAEWARQASGDQTRRAVLQYILDGELRREVASKIIQEGIEGTWLRNLTESPLLTNHFDSYQQSIILGELRIYDRGADPPPISPMLPVMSPVNRDPSAVLEDVHEWWIQAGDYEIRKYEKSVYGGFRLQLSHPRNWEDSQTRESWLTLFMLGALHTMGRRQPEQHRSFIKLWRDNGWLQEFADPQTNQQLWIQILVDFLDQSGEIIEFYDWMRQYASFVQFAKWLKVYADAFLEIDRCSDQFLLTDITRLRSSSRFQGSDLYAPSIDRALGIGACFVVRELMRLGVLSSESAHEHCYTPVSRVRKLLESIGCPDLDSNTHQRWERSKTIYEFLSEHLEDRATFNKAYDVPFLIIANDENLQNQFFRTRVLQDVEDEETYE